MEVAFENIRQAERITEDILPLKELMDIGSTFHDK